MIHTYRSKSSVGTGYPVFLPYNRALNCPDEEFQNFISSLLRGRETFQDGLSKSAGNDTRTDHSSPELSTSDIRKVMDDRKVVGSGFGKDQRKPSADQGQTNPFMRGLMEEAEVSRPSIDLKNKMFTDNDDVAFYSTGEPLVDLFTELEERVTGPRLRSLLESAWRDDALMTLKIVFNARSIHLGKASRVSTYRCLGWLAAYHPLTLVKNLRWLSRPVVEKPRNAPNRVGASDGNKEDDDDNDFTFVDAGESEDSRTRLDAKNGLAHGYWKDLLNILVLSVNDRLDVQADVREVLNVHGGGPASEASDKIQVQRERHTTAIRALAKHHLYLALHLVIARLFAEQLKADLLLLHSQNRRSLRHISLCAKWAPSQKMFHDKHTFIVSSISEIMHPPSEFDLAYNRETYLRHARQAYRKDLSSLRSALQVVERDMTAKTYGNIDYERVPSLAMARYADTFMSKDTERFDKYLDQVAQGTAQVSGAILLPSSFAKTLRETPRSPRVPSKKRSVNGLIKGRSDFRLLQGQWESLVQRVKKSGALESSIAVCDVSGSMYQPVLSDGTTPLDSSIGLSLLIAEVAEPPFGDAIITFSEEPMVHRIPEGNIQEKYWAVNDAAWAGSTDFVAVFEKLILPMAKKNNLKQKDMVKKVFVFSDMQFNQASNVASQRWTTSYERIKRDFELYGYELPELIFWNLASGSAGKSKPVDASEPGTSLVSGYSQGMLKVFLESGSFEEAETEEEIKDVETKDGEVIVEKKLKQNTDPLATVRRAVSHKAYDMLAVFD